jgi:hypothetical protein
VKKRMKKAKERKYKSQFVRFFGLCKNRHFWNRGVDGVTILHVSRF